MSTAASLTVTDHPTPRRVSIPGVLLGVFLIVLWGILCRLLSLEWTANEQYNYGWFVPFLALYLFWLRWEDRPKASQPHLDRRSQFVFLAAFIVGALLLLCPIRFFETVAPEWRPLAWLHAIIVVSLTLFIVWSRGGKPWLRHFAFPIAFILVAVPWILIEYALIQGLMHGVAAVAAEALQLCGIPAQVQGNLIRINNGVVGVNEACSGIRSLQTSLMIGLLFGELYRFNLAGRIALVLLAAAIALLGNLIRAFLLVFVAARDGLEATSKWHDWTGYSITLLVFAGTILAAALIRRSRAASVGGTRAVVSHYSPPESVSSNSSPAAPGGASSASPSPPSRTSSSNSLGLVHLTFPPAIILAALCWLLLIEIGVEAWYHAHEINAEPTARWSVDWPESAPGFRDLPLDDNVRSMLRFDQGRGAIWLDRAQPHEPSADAAASPAAIAMYFFRWLSGRTSIIHARAHHPDACMPAIGWHQTHDDGTRLYSTNDFTLPFRHFEFVRTVDESRNTSQFAHTFFCVHEDAEPAQRAHESNEPDITEIHGFAMIPYLFRVASSGKRPHSQQVVQLVFVTSNQVSAAEAETHFNDLFGHLIVKTR
jgi:exosortase